MATQTENSTGRRFVNELGNQESVNQIFLASGKQLRSNRQGNLYLQVELSDKTGSINTRLWNANDEIAGRFDNGDYVRVEGTTQVFQGALQLIAKKIAKASVDDVEEQDFRRLSAQDIDRLAVRLGELLRSMSEPHLLNLAECFLADEAFMKKFCCAPAGIKNHHAYNGGLLEHVVNLMEVVERISDRYPVDRDLLLFGAFIHDAGKIDEMSYEGSLDYTTPGRLLGHIVIATGLLDQKVAEAEQLGGEPFPEELKLRVKHMIVSHHGTQEFGSPAVPMTMEAIALHHLDNLDAKINHFHQLLRDDANVDSQWTQYQHNLGRYLYKG